MTGAFIKVDKRNRTLLLRHLKLLDGLAATAGIQKEEGRTIISQGFRMIDLAVQNEFGISYVVNKTRRFFSPFVGEWFTLKKGTSITIPATRFVSRIIINKKIRQKIVKAVAQEYQRLLLRKTTAKRAMQKISEFMANEIKLGIIGRDIKPKRNSPMTVRYKGFNHRLFARGSLLDAIKGKVQ